MDPRLVDWMVVWMDDSTVVEKVDQTVALRESEWVDSKAA